MARLAHLPTAKQAARGILQSNGVLTRGKVRDVTGVWTTTVLMTQQEKHQTDYTHISFKK